MTAETKHQGPLVSVIIPTYNRPDYLKQAIASVVQQTYTNLEIIVSDDCSPEHPQPIIDAFQDARIRLRRNPTNLGIGLNATYAFKEAQGKYVASLNDDDLWCPDFLEKLVPPLEASPDLALAFCDYFIINSEGTIDALATEKQSCREKRHQLPAGIYRPFWELGLIDRSVFAASAALIRYEAVAWERLQEAGVFWDYYISYLACRSGQGAYYCPERLACYRIHAQSENMTSGNRNAQAKIRKGKAGIACYESFMADAPTPKLRKYFEREWAYANTTLGIGLLRANQAIAARPYLLRSLQYQKLNLRTMVALALSFIPQSLASPFLQMRNVFAEHSNHL
ncbi:glycosyltransferase family 2 protein [Trichocoleus sp. FACHB-262]|uniref:glycosyltransferase family 2 protein n=1 Tax=Trichocoleus sp. FACHB-262 TaxID=2692869 RepID=UPI001688ED97|nr:glycosyltransferase family 2 protein [Trichocoleus sp. FACHB-262]MBD2122618.1 glycosyltransferase family 2 protein [Trichocoleus sp. FACHB-262]